MLYLDTHLHRTDSLNLNVQRHMLFSAKCSQLKIKSRKAIRHKYDDEVTLSSCSE